MATTLQLGTALYMWNYNMVQKKSSALYLPSHLWSCVRADCCRTSVYAAPWTTRGSSLLTARWTLRTPTAQHTCLMGSNRVHNISNKWHRILKLHILLGCDAASTGISFRFFESLTKPLPTLGLVCVPIRSIGITSIVLELLLLNWILRILYVFHAEFLGFCMMRCNVTGWRPQPKT